MDGQRFDALARKVAAGANPAGAVPVGSRDAVAGCRRDRREGCAMTTKRSLIAIVLAVAVGLGLLGLGSHGTAAAAPTTRPAETLCAVQGGAFIELGGLAYVCLLPGPGDDGQIRAAAGVCEGAYRGSLFVAVENAAYVCVLPAPA